MTLLLSRREKKKRFLSRILFSTMIANRPSNHEVKKKWVFSRTVSVDSFEGYGPVSDCDETSFGQINMCSDMRMKFRGVDIYS